MVNRGRWTMGKDDRPSSIVHGLILASSSPRRQEFLRLLGIPFRVHPAHVDETPRPGESPQELVLRLSRQKAMRVARDVKGLILAADTIVVLDGRILGKPSTVEDAWAMLRALRGRWHRVYTAVTLWDARPEGASCGGSVVELTRVKMRAYTDEEMERYIRQGNPFDKAGGYAIQDEAFRPVERVEGCMANVMGLPIKRVLELLEGCGMERPEEPTRACVHIFGWCCMEERKG